MFTLIGILLFSILVLVYVLWGRDCLKPIFPRFFAFIEPAERWLWNKSETILWSRLLMLIGVLPVVLDHIQLLNVPSVISVIPAKYQPYMTLIFTLIGIISEVLRRHTTKPLEMVALPDKVPPDVAIAVKEAEVAKKQAVAVVNEAKREGQV
jgi:hypothetical protein